VAPPLRFIAWDGMPDPAAAREAAGRIGRGLEIRVVSSNEELELLVDSEAPFDVITPSDYLVEKMIAAGSLLELDRDRLPGLASLAAWVEDPAWDPGNRFSVPFAFGTTGYLFDRTRVDAPASWRTVFEPVKGCGVGLLSEVREVVGAALVAAGYGLNDSDEASLLDAEGILAAVAPSVANVSSEDFISPVRDGRLSVHQAWSGPAARVVAECDRLGYALPGEGAVLWVTAAAVPADAPDPEAAQNLIAELMKPELARLAVENGGYSSPNEATRTSLDRSLASDPVLFPGESVLASGLTVEALEPAAEQRFQAVFDRFVRLVGSAKSNP
jgi:spermidine/putrescine-binding protein